MKGWLLGAACAMLIVAAPQSARAFEDGHALMKAADSQNDVVKFGFTMFVAGVAAGGRDLTTLWITLGKVNRDFADPYCVPPKITYKDLGDVVRVWLRSHPKLRGLPSGWAVLEALAERFPCK